jgi:predicted RNA-binding Zn ribbon-like protein
VNVTETAETLKLVGGALCLDFINTVDWRAINHSEEHLTSYAALVAWSRYVGTISNDEAQYLLARAEQHPAEARTTLDAAISLREALYRIFLSTLAGSAPNAHDLAIFNAAHAQALAHSEIAPAAEGFSWRWKDAEQELDRMLWPITRSAADLLLSPNLKRLKECSSPDCGWLFLDTSKNHTRRWCTMEDCGNRAKARSHYQRKRQSAQAGT